MSRHIPIDFDPVCLNEIDRRLTDIATTENVTIPFAIESGSRAWGFPSPDSDYDARFLFYRPLEHYANLWPPRDVIEQPIEGDMDVNGWDLGKALKLMLKGNAVILEWLQSPIVYQCDDYFRNCMLSLAQESADRTGLQRHYYHLGSRQLDLIGDPDSPSPVKKLFYAARPALALRWLRIHPESNVPPMEFGSLLRESDPPFDVKERFTELVAKKAVTRELGSAPVHACLHGFIREEFSIAIQSPCLPETAASGDIQEKVQAFFFDVISGAILRNAEIISLS
jgi:uncharacterized protein